jgi:glucan 1,3-beta-glucosidase
MESLNCGTGIDTDGAGSLTVLDSTAHRVRRVIATGESGSGEGSLVIDNLSATSVGSIVQNYHDNRIILPGTESSVTVDTWAQGNVYLGLDDGRYMQRTLSTPFKPPGMLDQGGRLFTRTRPVYQDSKAGDIVNVKDRGARGDGHSDDTAILNSILLENAKAERITYFPHGYYVITDTIYVPPNSRIIGEVWSAEISDMLIETGDILPGAILIEFNLQPAYQSAVGMWDFVVRVGGAASTGNVVTDCNVCKAAFLKMHITSTGGEYFEN